MCEGSCVEVACDVCALQVDAVLGGISCLGADIGTIAVRNGCAAVQDECVLHRVARFLVAVHAVACLKVLGKSGVGCGCDRAARNVERVLFDGVADFAASAPCFGVAAGAVGRMVVPEAVARDVDVLCACGFTVGVEDVFVVAVLLGFPCTGRIVVRKGHVVRAAQKRQDVVARRACRDGVEVLQLHLAPVDRGVAPVREGEHGIPVADVVCCVEVDVLEVLHVRRTCIPAVDVQGVACDVRPVAAPEGSHRGRRKGVRFRAKVDHVARGAAGAAREAAVNVTHAAARDVDGRARGASRGGIVPVDVAHRAARNPQTAAGGIACPGVVAAVEIAADTAARDVYFTVRDRARGSCLCDMPAVDIACDRAACDRDFALVNRARCICSGKGCAVDIRDGAACDLCGVLGRIA